MSAIITRSGNAKGRRDGNRFRIEHSSIQPSIARHISKRSATQQAVATEPHTDKIKVGGMFHYPSYPSYNLSLSEYGSDAVIIPTRFLLYTDYKQYIWYI